MLDIHFIEKNKEILKEVIKKKKIPLDLEKLLYFNEKRKALLKKIEALRHQRNLNIKEIEKRRKEKKDFKDLIEKGKALKKEISKNEKELKEILEKYNELLLLVPNVFDPEVPVGDESKNKIVKKWGKIPKFDFKVKSHIELGEKLDLLDLKEGAKVSGFRGYFLKNEGVLMHLGVLWLGVKKLLEKGFQLFLPPTLVREFVLFGSGHFPLGKEDIYQIANPGKLESGEDIKEKIYLVGTSEPSLLGYFAKKTFREKDLPIKVCGISQCYRSEVGSYGKDTKGLFRVHEFAKVEQVIICKNDIQESNFWLEKLRENAEELLQELEIPYRVVLVASEEMGYGKYKMYDIECFIPSQGKYRETHSDSNLTDWQARRLQIKYKTKTGKTFFCHTLNNTMIASPRILIPLWEINQTKEGFIKVPKVLRKFVGKEIIKK